MPPIESSFHGSPKAGLGFGAKKFIGSLPENIECIPPTGSQTDIAFQVSPWYPPRAVANFVLFFTPFECQYWSAIFIATSTETDPESEKNIFCILRGEISIKRFAKSTAPSCVSPPNITWLIFAICLFKASFICSLLYPWATAHHDDIPSITSSPPARESITPLADSTCQTLIGLRIEAYGCQTCSRS